MSAQWATPVPGAKDIRWPCAQRAGVAALAALAVLGAGTAIAQTKNQVEARYTRDFRQCMSSGEAAGGVTAAMQDCTGLENGRQDARLNQTYQSTLMRLSPVEQSALRVSERGWITQRKRRCDQAAAVEEGGTLAAVIYSRCMLDETVKRTMWLEAYRP